MFGYEYYGASSCVYDGWKSEQCVQEMTKQQNHLSIEEMRRWYLVGTSRQSRRDGTYGDYGGISAYVQVNQRLEYVDIWTEVIHRFVKHSG